MVKKSKIESIKLVHRITATGGHRLEEHVGDKEPVVGSWATARGIALLGKHAATTEHFNGILPKVFKIVEVAHRELTD